MLLIGENRYIQLYFLAQWTKRGANSIAILLFFSYAIFNNWVDKHIFFDFPYISRQSRVIHIFCQIEIGFVIVHLVFRGATIDFVRNSFAFYHRPEDDVTCLAVLLSREQSPNLFWLFVACSFNTFFIMLLNFPDIRYTAMTCTLPIFCKVSVQCFAFCFKLKITLFAK